MYDAIIVGGGPGGLAAALTLGRARRSVLLCDAGPRRNAAAEQIHNFVTRDGTPPDEFRRVGREQLREYDSVEVRDVAVQAIEGQAEAFSVRLGDGVVSARKVVLATGMVDAKPLVPGLETYWGTDVFQCPFCHGWEHRERPWGFWALTPERLEMPLMLRCWTDEITLFTGGAFEVEGELAQSLGDAGVRIEGRAIASLQGQDGRLRGVELEGGDVVPIEALIVHPPQEHVPLVRSLELKLDEHGYVEVDPMKRTSRPGIFAIGDLTTPMQAAIMAAAGGAMVGAAIVHELSASV